MTMADELKRLHIDADSIEREIQRLDDKVDAQADEIERLVKEVARWKDRAESAENSLVLATDYGMPAW